MNNLLKIKTQKKDSKKIKKEKIPVQKSEEIEDIVFVQEIKQSKKEKIIKKEKKIKQEFEPKSNDPWFGFTPDDIQIITTQINNKIASVKVLCKKEKIIMSDTLNPTPEFTYGEVFKKCLKQLRERVNANS